MNDVHIAIICSCAIVVGTLILIALYKHDKL